jgi:hypothetical protein
MAAAGHPIGRLNARPLHGRNVAAPTLLIDRKRREVRKVAFGRLLNLLNKSTFSMSMPTNENRTIAWSGLDGHSFFQRGMDG